MFLLEKTPHGEGEDVWVCRSQWARSFNVQCCIRDTGCFESELNSHAEMGKHFVSKEVDILDFQEKENILVDGFIVVQSRMTIPGVKAAGKRATEFTNETMIWNAEIA